MSAVSASGNAYAPPWDTSLLSALNSAGKSALPATSSAVASASNAPSAYSDSVSLSSNAKILSSQNSSPSATLMQRAAQLGQATESAALQFVSNFAKSLFGDAANSMQLSLSSDQLSASSSYSSTEKTSSNGQGQTRSATATLQDASEFVGTGTLQTADGKRFTFQVEVQIQDTEQSSVTTQSNSAAASDTSGNVINPIPPSSASPATATATAPAASTGPAIPFADDLKNLLALLHQGQFHQPVQLNASNPAGTAAGASQSAELKFSLLNQLPASQGLGSTTAGA